MIPGQQLCGSGANDRSQRRKVYLNLWLKPGHEARALAFAIAWSLLVGRLIAPGRSDKITVIFKYSDFIPDNLRPLDISRGRIGDLQSLRSGHLAFQTKNEIRR